MMNTLCTIAAMSALAMGSLVSVVILYRACVAFVRVLKLSRPLPILTASVVLLLLAGLASVWLGMDAWEARMGDPLPVVFRIATLCEYLAGAIGYVEMLSLLSRGYSLRILADLAEAQGVAEIADLKKNYGDGMGVSGILDKRLNGLRGVGFISYDGRQVGPLTLLGGVVARVGRLARRVLRLETVG